MVALLRFFDNWFPFVAIARTAALVLHVDAAFILLPVCRNFISFLRQTALGDIIPFDKNITFHKATAWSIVLMSVIHVVAHMFNFAALAIASGTTTGERVVLFFKANFLTGPGATGWVMNFALGTMVWFAMEKQRRANFERFWYVHMYFRRSLALNYVLGILTIFLLFSSSAGNSMECSA